MHSNIFLGAVVVVGFTGFLRQNLVLFKFNVVGFTTTHTIRPITTKVVSSNPVHGEAYSIQHYVIKFVSDLRQVSGFLRILRFPPPIKLTPMI
jgi:hypothetical protein